MSSSTKSVLSIVILSHPGIYNSANCRAVHSQASGLTYCYLKIVTHKKLDPHPSAGYYAGVFSIYN